MNEYTVVYEINYWSNGLLAGYIFDTAIGLAILSLGLVGLILVARKPQVRSGKYAPVCTFIVIWAIAWLSMLQFSQTYQHIDDLVGALRKGDFAVAEGVVEVIHQQPANGHAAGDEIEVAGMTFEVNYFKATPAYRQTIAHGGALVSGAEVRLGYVDRDIVRVEVKNTAPAD